MTIKRFSQMLSYLFVACGLGAASAAIAQTDVELEAEAAKEFARIKAQAPLTTDQDIIDYIACVANAVVISLEPPDSDLNWEMAIVETQELNAFVMPGGKIVVYEGILRAARDQHQLAAVIGHEIAHVTAEHTKRKLLSGGGKGMEIGIQVAAVLLGGGNYGATYTAQEMLNQGAMYGILLPYKRSQETEADVIGLEYMAKAGFDPRAAVPLWQNMQEEAGGSAPAEFASTHPSSENRIESLISQWIEVLPLYNQAHEEGRIPDCPTPDKLVQTSEE
ncbi:MAG: M48 family metalloprotease [Woeseiaceae bacterium]|nr:M48 family metalloprotease [Woeseiaceae bacterium]NIP21820.1 M48 family metalloprotease [Woeseiaceae bacterium]NIS90905.1 M48 family metalloprotease [Woeseiaceae bacterium]